MTETRYQSYEDALDHVQLCTTCGKPTKAIVGYYNVGRSAEYGLEPCLMSSCPKHCHCT